MGSSIDHSLRGSRNRSLALLIAAASLVVLAFLAAHARSAGATGATPTITSVNGGSAVAATGAKVIIPITGTDFASPKVTITGTSGNVAVLGLASGTTSTHLNVIVRLPGSNDAAGAKVVTVKNHKAGSTSSSLTVDAAPTITSIDTSSLYKGGSEDIAITGTGFRAGATPLAVPGVTWSNVTRNSSTSLTATAVVSATPTGTKRVIQVSNPSDGGFSTSVGSATNRLSFVNLPKVGGYFYFGQNSATTTVSIDGLPTTSGNLTSVSFGSNASPSFNTSAWNAAKASSITGTLSFGATAVVGDRAMTLSFANGLSITSPRALYITPAPKVRGYGDQVNSFPYAVSNSGNPQQVTIVGSDFAATSKSGLTPTASVSGPIPDLTVEAFYGDGQTTGFHDSAHLFVSFTATTCSSDSDSLTITNPTQAGSAGIPGIVGGSVTISNAISISCVPEIDSITPDTLPADNQFHTITISGRNFATGATVSNSNIPAGYQNTTVVDSNTITTDIRGDVPVNIGISVTNPNGAHNVVPEPFTFQSVPLFTSFSPNVIPLDSSPHTVTIVGSQFLPGAVLSVDSGSVGTVTLGSTTYIDYNHLSVSVTGVTAGAIDLTVDNTDGGTGTQVDAIGVGVAPSITAASLSGTPTVGGSVDANVTATGTPTPDLTYQWYRCTSAVSSSLSFASVPSGCTVITGATDASYTPVTADRTRYVTVLITAANGDSPNAVAITASSSLTLYAPYFTNAFVNISGGEAIGSTVSAGSAVFGRPSPTLSYQWYDCVDQVLSPDLTSSTPPGDCTAISGATSSNYTIRSSDAGSYVTVAETATNGISPDAGAVANSTDIISGPVGLRSITISGSATAGSTLTSDVATYGEPAVSSTTYQWYRCTDLVNASLNAGSAPGICTAIDSATADSYTIDGATDAGSTILLDVSVSGGTTSSEGFSSSTGLVTGPPGFSSFMLVHSAFVGDTLTPTGVAFGYPTPTVTYIWYQCTSAPADTLSAGSSGGATYLTGYGCTALTPASSSSSFNTTSSSAGDILAVAATATYGLSTSTAVSSTTLQAP